MHVLVVHGPNLNLFGRREPGIYGAVSFDEINARLRAEAASLGVDVTIVQSNHEGVLLDAFHQHIDLVAGALINAGGLTHTSVALHDCIKAMPFPVIEVHMSNIHAREPFRHHSMIAAACLGSVAGFGWRSYTAALQLLVTTVADHG
jgi:3-dehydroquinate dehydratase-2